MEKLEGKIVYPKYQDSTEATGDNPKQLSNQWNLKKKKSGFFIGNARFDEFHVCSMDFLYFILELVSSKHYTQMDKRGFAEHSQGNRISTSFKPPALTLEIDFDILDKPGI